MAILRYIKCDVEGCQETKAEEQEGHGFDGWGAVNGIALNGHANPNLCPKHLALVAEYTDKLRGNK